MFRQLRTGKNGMHVNCEMCLAIMDFQILRSFLKNCLRIFKMDGNIDELGIKKKTSAIVVRKLFILI